MDGFIRNMVIFKLIVIFFKSLFICLLYVIFDKKYNKQRKLLDYIFIFVFSDVYVIIDAIKSIKEKKIKFPKSLAIIMLIMYVFTLCSSAVSLEYQNKYYSDYIDKSKIIQEQEDKIYYDKYGKSYSSLNEVIYYTQDGAEFIHDDEKEAFVLVRDENNKYQKYYHDFQRYIDEEGWLFLTEEMYDELDNHGGYCYYDAKLNKYYGDGKFARWDENGEIYFVTDNQE